MEPRGKRELSGDREAAIAQLRYGMPQTQEPGALSLALFRRLYPFEGRGAGVPLILDCLGVNMSTWGGMNRISDGDSHASPLGQLKFRRL